MKLNELKPPKNSKHYKKRLGKGDGSGTGKTSGRGMNGQKARSGGNVPVWFEGGQMPIHRRLPKKGFNNRFKTNYRIVSLNELSKIDAETIDEDLLIEQGLIASSRSRKMPVKVLANKDNEFKQKVVVKAHKFSKKAQEIIENNGGKAEVV